MLIISRKINQIDTNVTTKKKEEYFAFEPTFENERKKDKKPIKDSIRIKESNDMNYFLNNYKKDTSNEKIYVFHKVESTGVVLKETWSKGLDFFFLNEGETVQIIEQNDTKKWVKVKKEDKIGLFHMDDLFIR
jgi:hypothetical protein